MQGEKKMSPKDIKARKLAIERQLERLRKRAQDLTQVDIFGNSACNQVTMFGGNLPEIRVEVNTLLKELEQYEQE
jgi:hypothetical protein